MAILPEGFYQKPSQYNPQAQGALSSVLARGQQNITNPTSGFEPIRQATTSHFNENIIPGITERFAASGSNAPSSGALQQQLAQAGSGLSQKLAAMQAQFGQQQEELGTRQVGLGLSHPTEDFYTQPSQFQSLLSGVGSSIPGLAEIGLKHYLGQGQQKQVPGSISGTQQTMGTGQTLANALAPAAGTALATGLGTAATGGTLAGLGSTIAGAAGAAAPFLLPAAIAAAIPLGIFGLYKLLED
jgi:hypothetical protein